jgi:hypothetical protein
MTLFFIVPSALIAPKSLQVARGIRAAGTGENASDNRIPFDEYYYRTE